MRSWELKLEYSHSHPSGLAFAMELRDHSHIAFDIHRVICEPKTKSNEQKKAKIGRPFRHHPHIHSPPRIHNRCECDMVMRLYDVFWGIFECATKPTMIVCVCVHVWIHWNGWALWPSHISTVRKPYCLANVIIACIGVYPTHKYTNVQMWIRLLQSVWCICWWC